MLKAIAKSAASFCKSPLVAVVLVGLAAAGNVSAALLGVAPGLPLTNYNNMGLITYNASTNQLSVDASPIATLFPPSRFVFDSTAAGPKSVEINIQVDSGGSLIGGTPGDDLVMIGAVDTTGDSVLDADGVLLTGEIIAFGFRDSGGPTDTFDFAFSVTGGVLTPFFAGQEIGVTLTSEGSSFTGSFGVAFGGQAKGNIGPTPPTPNVEICKLVTITGGDPFFDADGISGDSCDEFDQNIPVGTVGNTDATYRLIVRNTGTETLVNAVINDSTLGLVDVPVPGGPLNPGDERIIEAGDAGFGSLFFADRCEGTPGNKNNIARVDADGQNSGTPVSDDDPANVNCVAEPDIVIRKEVSLDGGPFLDANTPATGPTGALGADATYRLIVENTGTETLVDAVINDATLNLVNVPVPGGPLLPGDIRTITQGDFGFANLFFPDRCDSVGNKLNIARVDANGETTGTPVSAEDPANVNCENPQIELLKQVSLTGGPPFFDADNPGDPDVPTGALGADATYRLIVRNIGTETLIHAVVSDATLGLLYVPVPGGPLNPGDERTIDAGDTGFGQLFFPDRCDQEGIKSNIASVNAEGQTTGTPVGDDNPANVNCIEVSIDVRKEVSLEGGPFFDANTPDTGPTGVIGADATYRLIVENTGSETLVNAVINDATLDLVDVPVPGGPLLPGDIRVITQGDFGFGNLFFEDRCDSAGDKLNIARVNAEGEDTGTPVEDEDPAWVSCDFLGCRFTGGGVDTDGNWDHTLEDGEMIRNGAGNLPAGIDRYQFGGQAGANTALPPQPKGEWTHHQQTGPSGSFTFHGGTSSAPAGTEIIEIRCSDPGFCNPARNAPAKQLDFDGIGTFKSIGKGNKAPVWEIASPTVTAEGKGNKTFDGTFHYFEVNVDDLGEPGGNNTGLSDPLICPGRGFGEKSDGLFVPDPVNNPNTEVPLPFTPFGECDCEDFYRITIYDGVDAADVVFDADGNIDLDSLDRTTVIYEAFGYIDGGNLQLHPLTGFDR